jgi:hypothetical protein
MRNDRGASHGNGPVVFRDWEFLEARAGSTTFWDLV